MKAPRAKLAQAIADQSLTQADRTKLSKEVAAYLISEHRTAELESLLRDVQAVWADAGHVQVIARSAHPLTADIRKEIEQQVRGMYPQANRVIINELHDERIVGGVRLKVANQQLDLSIESKLARFRQLTVGDK